MGWKLATSKPRMPPVVISEEFVTEKKTEYQNQLQVSAIQSAG